MERDLNDLKEEIKARTDLVAVIGHYTRLTRAGKNWKGLCPFHNDRNPSFNVSPQLGIYKCFSCGESGDIITFIQKKENLEFVEALEHLARLAGIPFERQPINPEKASEREEMLEINRLAVRFFQDRLAKCQLAQDYLNKRAILKPTQEQWQLGYAPDDWEGLVYYLEQKKVNPTLALKLGLIKERKAEGRGCYDAFRNRLMFPIHDVSGRVIAFGGRALGDAPAKYLNSEQSLLFDKSRTLYGLYHARKKLSGGVPAVFVEGYMDVIATHQAGFTQCIATLGTSLTEEHARMLARYSPKVLICYDADSAGIKATLRGATIWEMIGVEGAEVRVVRLPHGDDPDSLLRRGETSAFQVALDNAVPRVDFQIELAMQAHDLRLAEGREAALAELIPILATISKVSTRQKYASEYARLHPLHDRLGIGRAIDAILQDVETYARQSNNGQSPRDRGYPLTQEANRAPLRQMPPAPAYRPPNKEQWGRSAPWPMTGNSVCKEDGSGGQRYGGSGRGSNKGRRREVITPPPVETPALTRAEKAERQLLRACFSPEWRAFVLSRLHPDDMVTPDGCRLLELLARTPADAEGGIDPRLLLAQIARREEEEESLRHILPAPDDCDSGTENQDESADFRPVTPQSAKFSWFIREIVEDFGSRLANEPLSESSVIACIQQMRQFRQERVQRELAELLRQADTLPPEQRRAYIEQYQQMIRTLRGSASDK
jgi:DNA primase